MYAILPDRPGEYVSNFKKTEQTTYFQRSIPVADKTEAETKIFYSTNLQKAINAWKLDIVRK